MARFRDPNPAFRRVAANIATTGRSQVPGHTDVIATDVDPTLTPCPKMKNAVLQALRSFLWLLAPNEILTWTALATHKTALERNKKQTSLVSKSFEIFLLSLNQRNQYKRLVIMAAKSI